MSKPTKEEWQQVEERLQRLLCPVTLRCDGYEVGLTLSPINQFRNAITVSVDGWFRGVWMLIEEGSEEGRRFFPTRRKAVWREAEKKRLIRACGKREAEKHFDFNKRLECRDPCWSSFNSLKRHFIANNESIELINE